MTEAVWVLSADGVYRYEVDDSAVVEIRQRADGRWEPSDDPSRSYSTLSRAIGYTLQRLGL